MDLIFEHEQLRKIEFDRRINVRNSFTPLKPLKNSQLKRRRNTIIIQDHQKREILNASQYSNNTTFRSISPLLSKFFQISLDQNKKLKENLRYSMNASSKARNIQKISRKIANDSNLPSIDTKSAYYPKKSLKDKRKHSQKIVTHIPTIAFLPN